MDAKREGGTSNYLTNVPDKFIEIKLALITRVDHVSGY